MKDKIVLITGAAGSIGKEIAKQIYNLKPKQLILLDCAESALYEMKFGITILTSITNKERLEFIFNKYKPNYVFHVAAYKHVPMLEQNPSEAVQNNIVGTVILAELAIKYNVEKFIFTSSDKAVNPSSVMGCAKRICEIYLQNLQSNTKFIITRFGNVLGSVGSVIPLFEKQISEGGPVTVTHPEMTRYFMSITEAALLTIEACRLGIGNEIFIFKMDEPIKIIDLAKQMIGNRNVDIIFTGLRPGEKLHEELFIETEITPHDKLLIVKNKTYNINIQELIDISYTFDSLAIIKKMQEFVPEFVSNNPEFYSICK